tara:strand:- start:672 stop:1292 length:621 start_codon:yes stop_codon:yes gene_type:complete
MAPRNINPLTNRLTGDVDGLTALGSRITQGAGRRGTAVAGGAGGWNPMTMGGGVKTLLALELLQLLGPSALGLVTSQAPAIQGAQPASPSTPPGGKYFVSEQDLSDYTKWYQGEAYRINLLNTVFNANLNLPLSPEGFADKMVRARTYQGRDLTERNIIMEAERRRGEMAQKMLEGILAAPLANLQGQAQVQAARDASRYNPGGGI